MEDTSEEIEDETEAEIDKVCGVMTLAMHACLSRAQESCAVISTQASTTNIEKSTSNSY